MQADDTSQSVASVQLLEGKGECTFDLSLDGPRLIPVLFGSWSNQPFEVHYHSFVGEIACGRGAISCCRRKLLGKSFTGFAIISQWRKSWSILGVSTNSTVGHMNSWDTSSRSFIVPLVWWKISMAWVVILMYTSIDILFKRMVCALSILQNDHLLTVSILLFFALIPVVPLFLTILLLLKQLRPFPIFNYSSLSTSLYFAVYSSNIFRFKKYCSYFSSYCFPWGYYLDFFWLHHYLFRFILFCLALRNGYRLKIRN